jgi:hypothetical protein
MRRIFDGNAPAEHFLRACNVADDPSQRYAVQRNRMLRAYRFQPLQARAACSHIVFRMHLKPQSLGTALQCGVVMLRLQAQTGCQDCSHRCDLASGLDRLE